MVIRTSAAERTSSRITDNAITLPVSLFSGQNGLHEEEEKKRMTCR